ncbi:DUF4397 domain-containing protein [Mesobacillus subterraneus]|uniref:DUF4397 domain-containing protein n=1 Tax=Mesobacillus subterraneus TaxID=285983 RepID=A0A427TPK0_9BACI|nr:DUF4397 domain-containing protein [Mesobacillus subterraneus]RSD26273.1 DUF4397 domain-containing protein [Mesobacillus subterraneus]
MSNSRNQYDYMHKASMYDLLANYYKYINPNLHVMYYHKHLRNLQKAVQLMRSDTVPVNPETARPSMLRFLHASPNVKTVDIYLNGSRVLRDFDYKNNSSHMQLQPGKYQVDIYPAGESVSTVISKKVTLQPGRVYTAAIAGPSAKLQLLTFEDRPQTPVGEAKARFIHLSPDAPAVDIAGMNGDIIFPNVSFKQATTYLALMPMNITLEARVAGTKNTVLTIPDIKLEPNNAYTIVVVGTAKGEPPLEVLLLQG